MDERDLLAKRFEAHRTHLRGVAYRMLGSASEADDAVQESWLRLSRVDAGELDNLGGWLTTVVARVCLDMLRARKGRPEDAVGVPAPEPTSSDPEQEALLADSIGVALLVVLETLTPAERIAFVLHDLFAVSFDEIASIVGRSPDAARQLASRARRRVQGAAPDAVDREGQRAVVAAFLAAMRGGDVTALLSVLDPELVVRGDATAGTLGTPPEVRGAATWAPRGIALARRASAARVALVDGAPGIAVLPGGKLLLVLEMAIVDGKITSIDVIADPARLQGLDLAIVDA